MYTDRDYEEIKKAYNKFTGIYLFAVTVPFIAAAVVSCIVRVGWIGYAAAAIWGVLTVFLWSMKGGRLRNYKLYLKEMEMGRQHEFSGIVNGIEDAISVREGVEFYAIELIQQDAVSKDAKEKVVTRRVYYDASKGKPPFEVGNHVNFVMYGNYIKEINNA